MAKRNVDTIKELNHELGRWQKKVDDQAKQIKEQKASLEAYERGANEMNRAIDSILAEVAVIFGSEVEPGTYDLQIPLPSVFRSERDYAVMSYVADANDAYIIRAVRRPPESEAADAG